MHCPMTHTSGSVFLNGLLHVFANVFPKSVRYKLIIVAIDGKGNTCRGIHWQDKHCGVPVFLGQSNGYLHCISMDETGTGLSIWILEDYRAEKWNLKHTVSFLKLFGREITRDDFRDRCNVAAIHPDCNRFFFVWENELISYDMNRDELCALFNVGRHYGHITPYFPYISESPALSKKH
ncbi:uncharacterized protein [Setaria viridis]|uniref:uncharacterized protein n=1 Tax=Setaria viridis TaxID=4556 RepID=UPI0014933611|nr:uncharacterized protein LOC117843996 [Setaria viridis]